MQTLTWCLGFNVLGETVSPEAFGGFWARKVSTNTLNFFPGAVSRAAFGGKWARKMSTNTWLFFVWCPLALKMDFVIRMVLSVTLGTAVLFGFLASLEFTGDETENVVSCWLALRQGIRRASPLFMVSTGICWCFLSFVHPLLSFTITIGAMVGVAALILWYDEKFLTHEIFTNWKPAMRSTLGWREIQKYTWMQLSRWLWPVESIGNQIMDEFENCDEQQLKTWFKAGVAFGGFLVFLSIVQWVSGSQHLVIIIPFMLVCFLGVAGYYAVAQKNRILSRTSSFIFGTTCAQSAACLLTGRVAGLYIGSGLTPLIILVMIFAKAMWVWLVGILVFGLVVLRVEPLPFRLLLLRMWWVGNGGHEVQSLKVPYDDVDNLKFETLRQIDDDKKTFRVEFTTECPFNLDQCDAGGLSKEWATLFAKGIIQGSELIMWPFFRKWDSESDVFHVNLEARAVEQMKQLVSHDEEEDVSGIIFRKLGVVIAKCFLRNFQLVPFSTALIKFVIRSDNDSNSKYSITYADFEELYPVIAKGMRTSPEHCPFHEISLAADILEEIQIQTGFQDGDFNAAKQPTEKKWDILAAKIVENQHVLPLLESFKAGFRKVIDMNLGELFSVAEVQQIMKGSASINLDDWRTHTSYEQCSACHPVIETFWWEMGRLSQQQLQMVCKFVTGFQTPPMEGFSALVPRFTLKTGAVRFGAHTCFNTLDLPEAMDLSMMKSALMAICGVCAEEIE